MIEHLTKQFRKRLLSIISTKCNECAKQAYTNSHTQLGYCIMHAYVHVFHVFTGLLFVTIRDKKYSAFIQFCRSHTCQSVSDIYVFAELT